MSNTKVTGQTIISGMFWRFGEKITAQMVSFIVSVVLARMLTPHDYGIVGIVYIFIVIAEVFVTSGLGTALIQKKDATPQDFSTLFWCNLALSGVLYLLVFVCAPWIAAFYDIPLLTPVLRVCALRLPINAVNSIQNAFVSRHMDFKKFFFATLIGTVISAVVGIVMAYRGCGVWALVAQMLTNTLIDTVVIFLTIQWKPAFVFSFERAKPLVSYGWKILSTDLLGTIFNYLNAFIIGKKYSSADLAYYNQGNKIPELINNNVGSTLSAVLFPAMSINSDIGQIRQLRRKSLKMMEYIIFPLMLGLFCVARNLILVIYTEKWLLSVPFIRISCVAAIINVFGTTLIQEIKAIGRSDITLKMELIKKPLFLVIILIAMNFGTKAIAFTLVINSILAFCFNVYPVRKHIGFDFKMHFLDALPAFAMSLAMCAAVSVIGVMIKNCTVCLLCQVISGGLVYVGLSILTRNESYLYLKQIILNKVKR